MGKKHIAAVPKYLGGDFTEASPALRFGMYLKLWDPESWGDLDKSSSLKEATRLNQTDRELIEEYNKRQKSIFDKTPENGRIELLAKSVAPFSTGLGNEHPLENGFAFLTPYGLPYLAGSGVKGVVRTAVRDLVHMGQGDESGWTEEDVDCLFGPSAPTNRPSRGALFFWDVMPKSKTGEGLMIEIMTPHYSHYYQQKAAQGEGSASPHDSGQPTPIPFLAVPPGSEFTFYVVCDTKRLPDRLAAGDRWKKLLESAFEHAFEWCGFGAKTSVGYGAMERDSEREERLSRERGEEQQKVAKERERQESLAKMSPIQREIQEVIDKRTDPNMKEIPAIIRALRDGHWQGEEEVAVARELKARMQKEGVWREESKKKNKDKDREYQNTQFVKGLMGEE